MNAAVNGKGKVLSLLTSGIMFPGDDLRFIDWNLYARLDKMFLKLFLEEEDLHFYCLIDPSESMNFGNPTKFHYARQLSAALGFIGLCRSDRVRIETLNTSTRNPGPILRGRQQYVAHA